MMKVKFPNGKPSEICPPVSGDIQNNGMSDIVEEMKLEFKV